MVDRLTSIENLAGTLVLNIENLECCNSAFAGVEIPPTGHNWAAAILSYCESHDIDVSNVEFDPESDLFAAYSQHRKDLERITQVVETLVANPIELRRSWPGLPEDEDLVFSVEDFVEDLDFNGVDLSRPLEVRFFLEFPQKEPVLSACKRASAAGYDCLLQTTSEPFFFAASVEELPTLEALQERVDYFRGLAQELGGNFIDCESAAEGSSPLEVFATDWRRFEDKNRT